MCISSSTVGWRGEIAAARKGEEMGKGIVGKVCRAHKEW